MSKTFHVAVSKLNRNSLLGLGRYHGKAGAEPSKAAAKDFVFMPGNAVSDQPIISVGKPVVFVRSHGLHAWITLIVEACPYIMVTSSKTLSKFSKN